MYFLALAADYDGTLAHGGIVDAETCEALRHLRSTGRRLILVTGRELPELKRVFPEIVLFDRVVAENGALIYDPATGHEYVVGPPPPAHFVRRLREMRIEPLSVGRAIVATWEPHQTAVLDLIRESGLELQIVFNKGAVMILPAGVNKATGLLAALDELNLSAHNVVAVGDAQNDHALLRACGCAAAVANALPAVKAEADIVLEGDHGTGVVELIGRMIEDDAALAPRAKHGIMVGHDRAGEEVLLEPYLGGILIAGPSASGKSTLVKALTERMVEKRFEFCVVDPEGDYIELRDAVCVGSARTPPALADVIELMRDAEANLVVNTQALSVERRRRLFPALMWGMSRQRRATGRPHWLLIDEAHQVLPATRDGPSPVDGSDAPATILVTVHPEAVAAAALGTVEVVLAFGGTPRETLEAFGTAARVEVPTEIPTPAEGEIVCWVRSSGAPPAPVRPRGPLQTHKRHAGKYASGDVGPHHSFYFRGPHDAMNVRAGNLYQFLDIGFAVGDEVWCHHLRAGHYSAWFGKVIKDEDLANEAARVEADETLDADESRRLIRKAIWRRYAAPVEAY